MLARVVVGPEIPLPQFLHGLWAGFPSPADDFLDESIDLSRLLIRNRGAAGVIVPADGVGETAETMDDDCGLAVAVETVGRWVGEEAG